MADASYDVVIVGGGSRALSLMMYLTKFNPGISCACFEERHELGTGWSCEESPAPGFVADTHSTQHSAHWYFAPVWEDIPEFKENGGEYFEALGANGAIFEEDDSCLMIYTYGQDPDGERTAKEIARFSERDAETYLRLAEKRNKYWYPAWVEWIYNHPVPLGQPDAMDRLAVNPDAGIEPKWFYMNSIQVVRDTFEAVETQVFLLRPAQSWGTCLLTTNGFATMLQLLNMSYAGNRGKGGQHSLAHAAHRVVNQHGGQTFVQKKVEKILIENGRAKGIRLEDGTEIEAKMCVVSTPEPGHLCHDLLGSEHVPREIMRKVDNISDHLACITWYTWALHEPPRWKGADFNPDIQECLWVALADKDIFRVIEEQCNRWERRWYKRLSLVVAQYFDASTFPPGKAMILTEQYVPPAYMYSEEEWKRLEKQHVEDVMEELGKYATNMNGDNVIGYNPITPFSTAHDAPGSYRAAGNWTVIDPVTFQFGRTRPFAELADFRLSALGIKNLYAAGAGWHALGSGSPQQGYIAYKCIAEDFGLRKPWEEKGRPY